MSTYVLICNNLLIESAHVTFQRSIKAFSTFHVFVCIDVCACGAYNAIGSLVFLFN